MFECGLLGPGPVMLGLAVSCVGDWRMVLRCMCGRRLVEGIMFRFSAVQLVGWRPM